MPDDTDGHADSGRDDYADADYRAQLAAIDAGDDARARARPPGEPRRRQAQWVLAAERLRSSAPDAELATAVTIACRQGFVLTSEQARASGVTRGEVRGLLRRQLWSSPRRGVLSPLAPVARLTPTAVSAATTPHGAAAQVRAAAAALARAETMVSGESAAAMHGLPLLRIPERPTLNATAFGYEMRSPTVLVRAVGASERDVTTWFGVPVTSVERTVMDLARYSGVAAALIAADAALNDGLTTHAALGSARERMAYRPGITSADRVLEIASALSESPLESLTRLCLLDAGLPAPELQARLETRRGVYRVDMLYPDRRVIIEADGELKYDRPGALVDEKRRQEALEQAGFTVVRVSWREVRRTPDEVVARVRWALARSRFA